MLTIMIPTKNRSDFVIRLLNYYAEVNFRHSISIGDSSEASGAERTKKVIEKLKNKLNIYYYECPNLNNSDCLGLLIESTTTPYAAHIADDDFLVPAGLEKCINFLQKHPEYNTVHGLGILFTLKNSGPYGQFKGIWNYALPIRLEESGSQRLLNHLKRYSVSLFSVQRTEVWKKIWQRVGLLTDRGFTEILPACLSVITGKIAQLDCFYLVRQGHDSRCVLPDPYDRINSPNWFPSYQIFNNCLTEELVRQDGITPEEAHGIVKQAFWAYLSQGMVTKYQFHYERKDYTNTIKRLLKQIPLVNDFVSATRRKLKERRDRLFPSNRLTLAALMSRTSVYHKDFMPVYRAITNTSNFLEK